MSEEIKIITHELLKSWNPCTYGYKAYCKLLPFGGTLEESINALVGFGKDDWGKWIFDKCKEHNLFTEITSKGYSNSGDWNSGDWNSGCSNSGDRNSGYSNSGDRNSGDNNSGYSNSGGRNSGDSNSGDWNSGDNNSGDWNSGDWNSGFFNNKEPDEILVFGKYIKKINFEQCIKPDFLYFNLCYWVNESVMTDDDKKDDPGFFVRGGQLRKRDYKEAFKLSWDNADKENRELIRLIPGFDAEIFFDISGIDLR
jgi:hypothetical protein